VLLQRLRKAWFLLALAVVLGGSLLFGHSGPSAAVALFLRLIQPAVTTAIVLFLMAFSLDAGRRRDALSRPLAAVWGSAINIALMPLLAWPLAEWQSLADLQIGLLVTAVVPCTLATASVFTRQAGGNDAVSLLVTLATNLACVGLTPLWLHGLLTQSVAFDAWRTLQQLTISVLMPTIIGQALQETPWGRIVAIRHRGWINFAAQLLVLLLVSVAATKAGDVLSRQATWPTVEAAVRMTVACILLHGAGVACGWYGSRALRLPRADAIAVAIAGSQKTLPIGLMIVATPGLLAAPAPFVTFPLLVFHACQLLMDSALAERWAATQASQSAKTENPARSDAHPTDL
jgi:solute carrier family 10 (sodium/bile acid cotransporter), member 7